MNLIFRFGKNCSLDGCDIEFIKRAESGQKAVIISLRNNETEESSTQEQMLEEAKPAAMHKKLKKTNHEQVNPLYQPPKRAKRARGLSIYSQVLSGYCCVNEKEVTVVCVGEVTVMVTVVCQRVVTVIECAIGGLRKCPKFIGSGNTFRR